MKKILVLLLAFTVIGMAIPAMADDEIAKVKNIEASVGGDLNLDNTVTQDLLNDGSQYNTNNGDVIAITKAASAASAGIQIGAFNNVNNAGDNVDESQAKIEGDVEDNSGNRAEAESGYVETYNDAYVDQYNDIYQDAYTDIYNEQDVENTLDIYIDNYTD